MSQIAPDALTTSYCDNLVPALASLAQTIPALCAAAKDTNLIRKLLRTQKAVHWKRHGIVVSNRSLTGYRGASLTVQTRHAAAVVQLLEQVEPIIEQAIADHPNALSAVYFYQRMGQAINDLPTDTPCVPCLQTVIATLNRLLTEDPTATNDNVGF